MDSMKGLITFFLMLSCLTSPLFSQVAFWQKYMGGEAYDKGKKIFHLEDGTLIIAGDSYSKKYLGQGNHGDSDIMILKYSTQGTIFWKRLLGGSGEESMGDCIATRDGGFLLVGHSHSSDGDLSQNKGGSDIWIVKLNAKGDTEWSRSIGGINDDRASSAIELTQGGYLIGGEAGSPNMSYQRTHHGGLDAWLARLNEKGEVIWEKQYGGSANEQCRRLHQLDENRFFLVGSSDSKDGDLPRNLGQKDCWFFQVNGDGELTDSRVYGGSANDLIHTSLQDDQGRLVMAGTTFSGDGDIKRQQGLGDSWIFQVDTLGREIWSRTYGGRRPEGFLDIKATQDGGFILCGLTKSRTGEGDIEYNSGYYEGWIFKCNDRGERLWSRTIGYEGKDVLSSLVEVPKGGYVALGYATQAREGFILPEHKGVADFWLCNISDPEREGVKPYVTPPLLIGSIKDISNGKAVSATLTLTENKTLDSLASVKSSQDDGSYALIMPAYGLVSINVLGEGYMFYGRDFLMDTVIDRTTLSQNILLDPIEVGTKLILKNIYFRTARWDLLEGSNAELERVRKFLLLNPRVRVEISGHTDNTGNRRTKEALSLNRANAVRDYLLRQGIPPYQMTVKGYGMYRPIASNKTPEGRAKNRRVEIEVIRK